MLAINDPVNAANRHAQHEAGESAIGNNDIAAAAEHEDRQASVACPGKAGSQALDARAVGKEARRAADAERR